MRECRPCRRQRLSQRELRARLSSSAAWQTASWVSVGRQANGEPCYPLLRHTKHQQQLQQLLQYNKWPRSLRSGGTRCNMECGSRCVCISPPGTRQQINTQLLRHLAQRSRRAAGEALEVASAGREAGKGTVHIGGMRVVVVRAQRPARASMIQNLAVGRAAAIQLAHDSVTPAVNSCTERIRFDKAHPS